MPLLLAHDEAPALTQLLEQANTRGLACHVLQPDLAQQTRIAGLGSLARAGQHEISFLANPRLAGQLATTQASAVVLSQDAWDSIAGTDPGFQPVICADPYLMYALLAQWFDRHRTDRLPQGIHPSASVDPTATLGAGVSVGPYAVIEAGVVVGQGTRVGPHCVLGPDVRLGADCLLHAQVTLYHDVRVGDRAVLHSGVVLGADGFGFAPDSSDPDRGWVKIAQLGTVQVGDDVEIGANTTVDRGALEDTVIGNGVKLDNQIMIAHNVHVGDHSAMAACVGVAGSTRIGKRCTIGGAAMLSGHIRLADDVHVSGGTAITSNVDKPGRYTGVYPYAEHRDWQQNAAVISRLASLRRRLRQLAGQID